MGKTGSTPAKAEEEDDDDVDLFGSDSEEEDADAARVREERLKAYADKKYKKPDVIAKTSVLFDVKPRDDETDMEAMFTSVKTIQGGPHLGSIQTRSRRLLHQKTASHVRRRGRQGLSRRALQADPGIRGLRPVGRHRSNVQNLNLKNLFFCNFCLL